MQIIEADFLTGMKVSLDISVLGEVSALKVIQQIIICTDLFDRNLIGIIH